MKLAAMSSIGLAGVFLAGCGNSGTVAAKPVTSPTKTTVASYAPPQAERSGRGPVQHGIDPGAGQVNRTPQKITVEQLVSLRKSIGDKTDLSAYPNKRIAPFETSTYEIDATIKSIKHEKDGDFYFVIQGDSGAQAVVEVPDPRICQGSPMLSDIEKARNTLFDKFRPTDENQSVNVRAKITGVGYLGTRKHTGGGSFGTSARLMPGIGVSFDRQ